MSAIIVVPWRYDPDRQGLWSFVLRHLRESYPDLPVVQSKCGDGPFNRAECIVRAALRSDAEVVVVHDADVVLADDLRRSIGRVRASQGWAVPHWHLHRLTPEATAEALSGRPLDAKLPTTQRPYKGNPTGTLVVVNRDLLLQVPPDIRFVGWGQEDEAWGAALTKLAGQGHRGSANLFHLWHPPAERMDRRFGNPHGQALIRRYEKAMRSQALMQQLVDESKALWRTEWNAPADADNTPPSPTGLSPQDTTDAPTDGSSPN